MSGEKEIERIAGKEIIISSYNTYYSIAPRLSLFSSLLCLRGEGGKGGSLFSELFQVAGRASQLAGIL